MKIEKCPKNWNKCQYFVFSLGTCAFLTDTRDPGKKCPAVTIRRLNKKNKKLKQDIQIMAEGVVSREMKKP